MVEHQKKARTTLQDVADKVGITKMTVSRYMRNPESVAEKTRAKIAVAIEEMGYIENRALPCCQNRRVKRLGFYFLHYQIRSSLPLYKALKM